MAGFDADRVVAKTVAALTTTAIREQWARALLKHGDVLPFLLPYVVPGALIAGAATGELWLFRSVSWIWVTVALLDHVVPPKRSHGEDPRGDAALSQSPLWRLVILGWVPVQVAVIAAGLIVSAQSTVGVRDLLLITVSIGIANGMLCIPVAHELMHRHGRLDHGAADVLMLSVSYPHFCIEHVHGHHRNVATPADPATARFGETFYRFYHRTLAGSVASAWRIERERLRRRGLPRWSSANRMLRYGLSLAAIYSLIALGFGAIGVAFFAAQSVIAFSTLEMINYVEHYGLTRREVTRGRYEPVRPWHSWDSPYRVSNWMLFNLGRHADHHCHTNKGYADLQDLPEAPQLPTGYFGLFLLPLCPPLWRRVMHPRVHAWRRIDGARRIT
jgi:alkane 1-monooxygenase